MSWACIGPRGGATRSDARTGTVGTGPDHRELADVRLPARPGCLYSRARPDWAAGSSVVWPADQPSCLQGKALLKHYSKLAQKGKALLTLPPTDGGASDVGHRRCGLFCGRTLCLAPSHSAVARRGERHEANRSNRCARRAAEHARRGRDGLNGPRQYGDKAAPPCRYQPSVHVRHVHRSPGCGSLGSLVHDDPVQPSSPTPAATCSRARAPSRRPLPSTSHQGGHATSSTSPARSSLTTGRSSPIRTTRTAPYTGCASTRPSKSPGGPGTSRARPEAVGSSPRPVTVPYRPSFSTGRSPSSRHAIRPHVLDTPQATHVPACRSVWYRPRHDPDARDSRVTAPAHHRRAGRVRSRRAARPLGFRRVRDCRWAG